MNTTAMAQIDKPQSALDVAMRGVDSLRPTFVQALPSNISIERFSSVVKTAINNKPELLDADRPSLYNACVMAAQDGLLPDNREGVLNVYNCNIGTKQSPVWVKKVNWQPMIGGLRKIAARHGFSLIDHAVHQHDTFEYSMGDTESITHKAPPLGQARGEIVGAYSIATELETGATYREVMDRETLAKIRSCAKTDEVWSSWPGEQARKSASRRLFKKLPFYMEEDVQRVLEHDDANYDLTKAVPAPAALPSRPVYTAADFAQKLETWRPLVTGGQNPEELIAMVESKVALSDEQKAAIRALTGDTK